MHAARRADAPARWPWRRNLAQGSQAAIRATKKSLNNWMRVAGPIFDNSLALEMLNFLGPDAREGLEALRAKRKPDFPSALEPEA